MKKINNKGFSLVELIVVIAIMAILAVTLAPRLTQYVEKSRKASDQEAVNTIFTAAKLANLEAPLGTSMTVDLRATDGFYGVSTDGRDWTINPTFAVVDATTEGPQAFYDAMEDILGDFELKSSEVVAGVTLGISTDADGKITVTLDYDGAGTVSTPYSVAE